MPYKRLLVQPQYTLVSLFVLITCILAIVLGLLGNSAQAATVAYWNFEEGSVGTSPADQSGISGPPWSVLDTSGNNYHMGVLDSPNAPTYSSSVPSSTIPNSGASNNLSLDFGGSPQEIYASGYTGGGLNDIDFSSSWTIETSFKLDTLVTGEHYAILAKKGTPQPGKGESPFMLRVRTDGNEDDDDNTPNETPFLEAIGLDGSGDDWKARSRLTDPIVAGQWYNVAVVYDGTTTDLYLDDGTGYLFQEGAKMEVDGWFGSTDDWVIGNRGGTVGPNPTQHFEGQIDEVRISDSALTVPDFLHSDPADFNDLVEYTIDTSQSYITMGGQIVGFDIYGQGIVGVPDPLNPDPNGTLTSALGGTIKAHLNGDTLTFDDLSHIDVQFNSNSPFSPALGSSVTWFDADDGVDVTTNFPATGEENLALDITPGLASIDEAALRDVFLGISQGSADFGGPVTGIEMRTKSARFDFYSQFQELAGETAAGSDLQGGGTLFNTSPDLMTKTDDGVTETITIPYKLEFVGGDFDGFILEGQIVASRGLGVPGDFNFDGDVNGIDFLLLQQGFGSTYDDSDYAAWEQNFGYTSPAIAAASAAIPEPSSILILISAYPAFAALRRRRVLS